MVMKEIYVLSKHAKMPPEYIEKIPVYKRRFYLEELKIELEDQKESMEKAQAKAKQNSGRYKRR